MALRLCAPREVHEFSVWLVESMIAKRQVEASGITAAEVDADARACADAPGSRVPAPESRPSEVPSPESRAPATLIVGLGKTGLACARYLARCGIGFAVTDSRPEPPGLAELRATLPEVPLYLGGFAEEAFAAAQRIVLSPGVALRESAVAAAAARGVAIVGDIELFARAADAPLVAVTGSNGKSTVTTLLGHMAAEAGRAVRVGGNLGTPALELLPAPGGPAPELYVLELSSFQLETTASLDAAAATVLNLSPDHMDRYRDVAEYAAVKQRIYRGGGVAVLNADDPLVRAMAPPGRRALRFGLGAPAGEDFGLRECDGALWLARGEECLLPLAELRIPGLHNAANALAALALGTAVGLPMSPMLRALRAFAGLPHRTEWVGERDGVRWYNDSKGTNVGATLAALRGLQGRVVLIAGGEGKGADFRPLRAAVAEKARAVVLIGRDAALLAAALGDVAPVVHAADLDEAVARARELARPGDSVLLSPACASFDMFTGYEHRGRVFTEAVQRIAL
jgi:UDP-N-acetylmuramoylalanine--D-glutamate ligase